MAVKFVWTSLSWFQAGSDPAADAAMWSGRAAGVNLRNGFELQGRRFKLPGWGFGFLRETQKSRRVRHQDVRKIRERYAQEAGADDVSGQAGVKSLGQDLCLPPSLAKFSGSPEVSKPAPQNQHVKDQRRDTS